MKKNWQAKKISLGNTLIVAAITLFVGGFFGYNWRSISSNFLPYLGFNKPSGLDWSSLDEIYQTLYAHYDGDLDSQTLIDGAKKGLTSAIGDVYTTYMTKDEAKEFEKSLHGEVGAGIGIEMALRDGYVRVIRTLPDNPAREAGILSGDILYKVNGEEVYNLSTEDVASKVRGAAGTEVTVTIVRGSEEKEFKLIREEINNVSADIEYDGHTAIVKITRFDTDTGTIVKGFAEEFKDKGINKVIIDLRGNGGGYVSAARDLLSLWLDEERILVQKSKHFADDVTTSGRGGAILKDMKTVVLVNNSTASASEIVAGALKDYKKATIIGETTYGKGVVQTLLNLSGGGQLKVTTAHWYTPLDTSINGTGITPDKIVENSYDDINAGRDPQLDAAKKE